MARIFDTPYLPARRALEQMGKDGTQEAKAAISAVLSLIDAGDVQRLPSAIAAAVEAVVPLSFERLDDPRRQRNALIKTWVEQALAFAAGHLDI